MSELSNNSGNENANKNSDRSKHSSDDHISEWSELISRIIDKLTGKDLAPTLRFAERLSAMGKPVWVRFVLAPGLTDAPDNIEAVARFVAPMKNVERVEVLPFHQMGAFKWTSLGIDYKLADTPTPTHDQVQAALGIFRAAGCRAR